MDRLVIVTENSAKLPLDHITIKIRSDFPPNLNESTYQEHINLLEEEFRATVLRLTMIEDLLKNAQANYNNKNIQGKCCIMYHKNAVIMVNLLSRLRMEAYDYHKDPIFS